MLCSYWDVMRIGCGGKRWSCFTSAPLWIVGCDDGFSTGLSALTQIMSRYQFTRGFFRKHTLLDFRLNPSWPFADFSKFSKENMIDLLDLWTGQRNISYISHIWPQIQRKASKNIYIYFNAFYFLFIIFMTFNTFNYTLLQNIYI